MPNWTIKLILYSIALLAIAVFFQVPTMPFALMICVFEFFSYLVRGEV